MFNIHDKLTGDFLRKDDTFVSAYETVYINDLPNMYKPKWDGKEWVETATEEEIKGEENIDLPQSHSVEERLEQTEQLLQATSLAFTEFVFSQTMGK